MTGRSLFWVAVFRAFENAFWANTQSYQMFLHFSTQMVNRIPVSHQILAGSAVSAPAQTDPGAHPASYIMGTGSLSQE